MHKDKVRPFLQVLRFFIVAMLLLTIVTTARTDWTSEAAGAQPTAGNWAPFDRQAQVEERLDSVPYHQCVPNALVRLDTTTAEDMKQSIAAIETLGGCALHVFSPDALIGFLPVDASQTSLLRAEINQVYRSTVDPKTLAGQSQQFLIAAMLWNKNLAGQALPQLPPPGALPLVGDVLTPPALNSLNNPPPSPGFYEISQFMAGKVAIGIILPESNNTLDPSTEDWSASRMDLVISEIQDATSWWNAQNPQGGLSFYYDIHRQVPTAYEPINRPSSDDQLWISETLGRIGFTTGNAFDRAFAYINSLRSSFGADWGMVVFIVDSLNDGDNVFPNGYFGYTYGSIIVMTYENDGWGISSMDSVFAHELAHNFGAADEYCSPGYACCSASPAGYLNIPNTFCEAGCDHNNNGICDGDDSAPGSNCQGCPTCIETQCLMRTGSTASGLDIASRQQVGIRDSDGDGILDPLDTIPSVSLSAYSPDPTSDTTPTWTGSVQDIPWDSPTQVDTSINPITAVRFRIDGGTWLDCAADDGAYNETSETFSCTAPSLAQGTHTIEVRASNRVGNNSPIVSDTLTINLCPQSFLGWKAEFWNNWTWSGSPVVCRDDPAINFEWTDGSPDPAIQMDYFSARWTKAVDFAAGKYNFNIYHDDGARLTIGGNVVYENLCDPDNCVVDIVVPYTPGAGRHTVILEMRENYGYSGARLTWAPEIHPLPNLSAISPLGVLNGNAGFTMTLDGSGFVEGSVARWGSTPLLTTFISSVRLTAEIPASLLANAGAKTITVYTPPPGGGTSGPMTFTIYPPDQWFTNGPADKYISRLAVPPPGVLFAGTTQGIYKSSNRTANWTPENNGISTLFINSLAVNPLAPNTMYAGTEGGGIFKTTDGAASWTPVNNGLDARYIYGLAIDPATPTTVYAGAMDFSASGGVYKSTNGGSNWSPINNGISLPLYVTELVIDPTSPATIYLGTLDSGIYKSTNGGLSWGQASAGLGSNAYITSLIIDPATPSTLYAGSWGHGVYRSTDGGATWAPANAGYAGDNIWALAINPASPGILYAGAGNEIIRSTNGGNSWSKISQGLGSVHALAFAPGDSMILYAGTTNGVYMIQFSALPPTKNYAVLLPIILRR